MFQFLIGKVQLKKCVKGKKDYVVFQFLIGKVQLAKAKKFRCPA